MENTTEKIKKLINDDIKEISEIKKTPQLMESNEYALLLHKKEIYNRILRILDDNENFLK